MLKFGIILAPQNLSNGTALFKLTPEPNITLNAESHCRKKRDASQIIYMVARCVKYGVRSGRPTRLNFRTYRAGPRAYPLAHGLTRNYLNVLGLFRVVQNYKKPKIHFLVQILYQGLKFTSEPKIQNRFKKTRKR
jgi:hypothetical protein